MRRPHAPIFIPLSSTAGAGLGHLSNIALALFRLIIPKQLVQVFLAVEPANRFDISLLQQRVELAGNRAASQNKVWTGYEIDFEKTIGLGRRGPEGKELRRIGVLGVLTNHMKHVRVSRQIFEESDADRRFRVLPFDLKEILSV